MHEEVCFLISEEESLERLDKILANRFSGMHSRAYFQNLIESGNVLLNGSRIKKRIKPKAGDEIDINFILTEEINLEPEPIPLDILYEDEFMIVVNKPAGMVVHPAVGNWTGTFANALLYHCLELNRVGSNRPGIVHRLDKDTTGLLVAGKTATAHQRLVELFAFRQIYKEYLALCVGNPGVGEISAPIGRHPIHRQSMAVVETGRAACTLFRTLAFNGQMNISFVSMILKTGRTHQIRVHMKHHGTPVLGDGLYGNFQMNKKFQMNRQMLHAYKMEFTHPFSKNLLTLEAPLPDDFSQQKSKLFSKF